MAEPITQSTVNTVLGYLGVKESRSIGAGDYATTVKRAIEHGWGNANTLVSSWEGGTNNCGEIKANLEDFKSYIVQESTNRNIDPYFLLSILAIESSGNPCCGGGQYKGLGQTNDVAAASDYSTCKKQVDSAANHVKSKAASLEVSASEAFLVAMAYNAGQGLFKGVGGKTYLSVEDATYEKLLSISGRYAQDALGLGDAKHYELDAYYPKLLGAREFLTSRNFLGDQASSTMKTRPDFETNKMTDWLLDPSEDERKYGINIYEGQQPLIKFSTAVAIDGSATAVEALHDYSEFLYYLLNSEVSTAAVQCLSMPWIRPGFNVWYDPLYADRVYYCMGVQHQGDPHAGASTSLSLILGRPSSTFINDAEKFGSLKKKSDNVLINEIKDGYRVSKFGDTVDTKAEFQAVKDATRSYYSSEAFETVSAEHSEFHKELYAKGVGTSPTPSSIDKNKIFSGEYTKEQIESQLSALYSGAPSVVKERVSKLKAVVAAADEYIEQYHLLEHHTS